MTFGMNLIMLKNKPDYFFNIRKRFSSILIKLKIIPIIYWYTYIVIPSFLLSVSIGEESFVWPVLIPYSNVISVSAVTFPICLTTLLSSLSSCCTNLCSYKVHCLLLYSNRKMYKSKNENGPKRISLAIWSLKAKQ